MRARRAKGLTQDQLAARAGCALRTVQRAERGALIRTSILHELSVALDCERADIEAADAPGPRGTPSGWRLSGVAWGSGAILFALLAISLLSSRPAELRPEEVLAVVGDVDADGRDELLIWHPSTGMWGAAGFDGGRLWERRPALKLGERGDIPLAGDVDGDGSDELIVWRRLAQEWLAMNVQTRDIVRVHDFRGGSRALVGDFDGDGRDDLATWRPQWQGWDAVTVDGSRVFENRQCGNPGDEPLVGDFDGDGAIDCAAWRPFTGQWTTRSLKKSWLFEGVDWGHPGDVPLAGDFDGDGRDDLAYWRPADGEWAARRAPLADEKEPPHIVFRSIRLGRPGDVPLVGDFDGDGVDDISVWTASEQKWSGLTLVRREHFAVSLKTRSSSR